VSKIEETGIRRHKKREGRVREFSREGKEKSPQLGGGTKRNVEGREKGNLFKGREKASGKRRTKRGNREELIGRQKNTPEKS